MKVNYTRCTDDHRHCHPDAALVARPTAETAAKLCAFAPALASQAPGKLVGGEKWDARIKTRGLVLCRLCILFHFIKLWFDAYHYSIIIIKSIMVCWGLFRLLLDYALLSRTIYYVVTSPRKHGPTNIQTQVTARVMIMIVDPQTPPK